MSWEGYTRRRDEKSAEVIDQQGVGWWPLCRYGCKFLKRKGLKADRAKAKKVRGRRIRVGEWQARGTIA